jgi:hypothetical protein
VGQSMIVVPLTAVLFVMEVTAVPIDVQVSCV